MKLLYSGLMLLILLTGCANFDKKDKQLISAGISLTLIDMYQTKRIFDSDEFYEINPLIRSKGDIIPVTLISNSIVLGVCTILPSKERKLLLKYWVGLKGIAVTNNYEIGIR